MPIFHLGDASRGQTNPVSEGVLGQPLGLPQLIKPFTNLHPLPLVLLACVQWHREDEEQKGHERHDKREPGNARRNMTTYRPRTTLKRRPNKAKTNNPAIINATEKRLLIERRPAPTYSIWPAC